MKMVYIVLGFVVISILVMTCQFRAYFASMEK
jgi:hypothetical protein